MNGWIEEYIKDHEYAWAETTRRVERSRLVSAASLSESPAELWDQLGGLGAYSRVQSFNRVSHYVGWLVERGYVQGPNEFAEFRRKNARLFKHVYERRVPEVSYEEALRLIERIEDAEVRAHCRELLGGALRYIDSVRRDGDHTVGKGGKRRKVYVEGSPVLVSYMRLYRGLKKVGLTPHMLRKIRLNQLAKKGMPVFELTEFAGWSDPKVAMSYIRASQESIQKFL
jgi:hypothetical protein